MKLVALRVLVAAAALLSASIVSAATFAPSDSVLLDTGGSLGITPSSGGGPYAAVVGAGAEYLVCVDSTDSCATNGLSIRIDLSDTLSAIDFILSGSTSTSGSFALSLSDLDFSPAGTIVLITPPGYGVPPLTSGTFVITASSADSIDFEGSGATIGAAADTILHFAIEILPDDVTFAPAPNALFLLALGIGAMSFARRRQRAR